MALREWKKSICISWDSNESERPSRPERAHIEDCWPGWGHVEDRGGRRWGGEQRENGWEDVNYFTISKSIGVNSSFLGPTSQLEMPRTHSEWVFYHARHCFTCRPNIPLYFQNGRMSSKVVFTMKSSETDSGPKEVYHLRSRVPWLLPLWRRPSSPDPQYLCPAEVMPSIVTGSSVPMPSWGDVAHPHRILSAYAQLRRPCTTHLQRKPFAQLMIGIAFSGDGEHSDALHPPITSRGKGSEDMMLAQERPSG